MKAPVTTPRERYRRPLRGPRYRPQRYVVRKDYLMQTNTTAGALTPYYLVAREAGLEAWALAKLEPEGFRCPDNVIEIEGVTYLTPGGIIALSKAVDQRGYAVMSHSLRVLARQQRETPSRHLITQPIAKDGEIPRPAPAWMNRADCV